MAKSIRNAQKEIGTRTFPKDFLEIMEAKEFNGPYGPKRKQMFDRQKPIYIRVSFFNENKGWFFEVITWEDNSYSTVDSGTTADHLREALAKLGA